jgi:magnesium-transporting ATPase (P-type)
LNHFQENLESQILKSRNNPSNQVQFMTDQPSLEIFYFDGITRESASPTDWIDLSDKNFVPRGATIRGKNAKVLCLVVYTGPETKIVLNNGQFRYKNSNTEKNLNLIYLFALFQIVFFTTIFTILGNQYYEENSDKEWWNYEKVKS